MARKVNVTIPKLDIQIHLEGEWVKAENLVTHLGEDIQAGYDKATGDFAGKLLQRVIRCMVRGIPPPGVHWEPLSQATLQKYGDHDPYYLTGLYSRSIGVFRYKSRTLIGLPINSKLSSQKQITLNQLAKLLEFGGPVGHNATIPARPLWNPSYKAMGGPKKLRSLIITEIRRKLRARGINQSQVRMSKSK